LASVEEPSADPLVVLDVRERLVPAAGGGQCVDAFGEQDRPQPEADLLVIGRGRGEVGELDEVPLDDGVGAGAGCAVEGVEQV